ncbi:ABC transporter substrate-binding protein [Rhodovarius crocodyli]|uniref:ABC transporter substrate-binding protein n=1 Tax=Rhodovarius crocodyli TaxID=1979269 RepID=A0A437M3V6_9PROT|nr:ABC transporter substrate-binding protein [Rhodovarius crocodyli]RVT92276.1 ABC transporter substrate-binding protein [Rhodovarius crocodyli]
MKLPRFVALALVLLAFAPQPGRAAPLRAVLEAEVATLDPHGTSAYITRAFGYMVYDTLFGLAANGEVRPQMVQDTVISDDRMTYTFTLRPGLTWHDGTPVTAADCVASLRRWMPRAGMGRLLAAATDTLEATDARSFVLKLKQPFGLVLEALGRPNTPVPFMMPERIARAAGDGRVTEIVGSGPFVFRADRYRPGDRIVLDRNPRYVPRDEPADFLAGGKRVNIEGLELIVMPDGATSAAALQAGEIDYIQSPSFDMIQVLERNRRITVNGPGGMNAYQGYYRLNHAAPPFNDPEIRRVLWRLFDQSTVLTALGLPERLVQPGCVSWFMCGTPLENTEGAGIAANPSVAAAREALRRTRYNNEPIVILQATDLEALRVSSAVAADLMRQAGFNVDLQAMDWGTLLNRRGRREGWHLFGVTASGFDLAAPPTHFYLSGNCVDYAGWSCDQRMVPLFAAFPRAQTDAERQDLARQISAIAFENTPALMWGQFVAPAAWRNNIRNLIPSSIPLFWGVEKQ